METETMSNETFDWIKGKFFDVEIALEEIKFKLFGDPDEGLELTEETKRDIEESRKRPDSELIPFEEIKKEFLGYLE